jgi:nicotinamidase-related amidase
MKTALLLIDIQNDYFPGGKMELEGSVQAVLRAKDILDVCRAVKFPVFHIQHVSMQKGASFFLPGTDGVLIHEDVKPLPDEIVIQKHYPNSFRETTLLDEMKKQEINRLIICGMMTHMCVDATVRAAFDHGFACVVIHDACAARALSFNNETIPADHVHGAFMAALGTVYARILGAGDMIQKIR